MPVLVSRFLLCASLLTALAASGQITTPYLYDNIHNNFSGTGAGADAYRGTLGVASHRFTFQSTFTGNNFYKINNQSTNSDNDFNAPGGSKVWSGGLTINTLGTAFAYGDGNGGAGSFPVTSGKYYTYNWQDVNTSSNASAIVMQTDNSPVSISSIGTTPAVPVNTLPVTVTVNLSGAPSAQENVFVRYSTSNFATYGTLLSPTGGSGTSQQTFTIPAQPANTTVRYYAFTSTLSGATLNNQATLTDMATIFFDNNGGANYSYVVALPIELTAFRAEQTGRTVVLNWTTATEQNNNRFEVERSADGSTWSRLTTVPTQNGNARFPQNYRTTDEQPLSARNYYRLRQVDTDGKFTFSPVRMVEMGTGTTASLAPNPVGEEALQLTLPANVGTTQVRLTDAQGRLLRHWSFDAETALTVPLDLSGIAPGVLFLQVNGDAPLRVVKN